MLIPVNTLKSVRKWRDRLFLVTESGMDRCLVPRGLKILFSPWPEIEREVWRSFRFSGHVVEFGPIPLGGGTYDLVMPVTTEALLGAAGDLELCRRNALPIPDPVAVNLCDDKGALNEFLRVRGFARHLPGEAPADRFPYMLKRRRDSCARHAHLIDGPAVAAGLNDENGSPAYLRQEWIAGETEFTAHLLHYRGRVRRGLSVSFRMHHPYTIRGRDPVLLMRRCHARHVRLFEAVLNAVQFEGLCCVNYKLRDGVPIILEINPRFGFSLAPFVSVFLRSLDWRRGG